MKVIEEIQIGDIVKVRKEIEQPYIEFNNNLYEIIGEVTDIEDDNVYFTVYVSPNFKRYYKYNKRHLQLAMKMVSKQEDKQIKKIDIPEIDKVENERICRAEYKINELVETVNELKRGNKDV